MGAEQELTGRGARPRVVFSRCLTFDHCRYNGQIIASEAVERLKRFCDCVTPCPEADIGLGIPREPIRIVRTGAELRLVQPATGRDVTEEMRAYAEKFLAGLGPVDGFVLKGRSPSCGLSDVKLFAYAGRSSPLPGKIAGFFGRAVLDRFPDAAVEDEGRLLNFTLREHFLTRIYTAARFRKLPRTVGALVRFQAENKLLLLGYNQTKMRELGRLVANWKQTDEAQRHRDTRTRSGEDEPPRAPTTPGELHEEYGRILAQALARPPRPQSAVNVLEHALGYFKDKLSPAEKRFSREAIANYRAGRVPLSVPQTIVRAYIVRFGESYLEQQTFFRPYPEELALISDSGKGRDL